MKDAPQIKAAMGETLDDFEQRFVEEYCVDLNHKAACVRCGERPDKAAARGRVLLRKPEIMTAIDIRLAELSKQSVVNAEWVRSKLKEMVERCMQAVPVMEKQKNADGEWELVPTGEYRFDSNGANKALENIGKHLGMFAEHSTVTVEHELKALSPAELDARIARIREQYAALDLVPGADGVFTPAAPPAAPEPAKLEKKEENEHEDPATLH